ncbi:zinc finger CCCH domain-containing protein 43 [Cucumis melo var. makuwa]|uniref:Zinc finger CCCH domain-containing protein 43 n=1 Tax=Cucumis melo var. makuwa TaxID=1194695 RepID=A0A5A7ULY8_CUCMM|nr:zinc finger CCCH domain-containing protein 43 [Cucumis melo var. makuwa]
MEPSEAVSVPNHCEAPPSGFQSSQLHSSVHDPPPFDAQHVTTDDRIHAELQKLDLKDEKEEPVKDFDDGGEWEVEKNPYEDEGNDTKKIDENDRDRSVRNDDDDGYDDVDEEVDAGDGDGGEVERKGDWRGKSNQYPVRPEAEDCAFYLKTGTCKFGSFCKFNHPVRKKNQVVSEKLKYEDDSAGTANKTECKFYLRTGGCKFGNACRYNHTRSRALTSPILELNFLGLPIRPDEKECPYYMRTGSCKYGANCKFNHPDPTTVAGSESLSGYNNGVPLQGASQSQITSWTSPRVLNEATTFVPAMISPSQDSEWNGYQAPIYPSEISVLPPPPYVVNNIAPEADLYSSHQQVDEYPERPGQPECSYFLKTGDCKFKSLCKYHHPKNRNPKLPTCTLNDKGLPLRPDQNVCTYYSRYGICKFGPSCKFDHPFLPTSSTVGELEQQPHYGNFSAAEGAEMAGGASGNSATVEQSA